ncbi:MAG: hypothetical protein JWN16_2525 [Alphaproteobacteria bacterium]|jgi:uncharacterized protein (DUF2336 family)|nr:hypothetical protein [Alphaproteobacteria bacterium]
MGFIVGLTAHDMSDMGRLAQLAMNPASGASREEIYLAVASLYRIQGAGLNSRERELMREILKRLTRDVEMAIRIALAQRLAEDSNAPHDLILLLVDDSIEVARPLIINSPLLTESDVLKMIAEAGIGHQEAAAHRPNIGIPVTDALVRSDHESVLLALVRNATAKISSYSYETLVQKSRAFSGLQEPLVKRPDLPPQLATKMCEWVSDALKTYIKTNYDMAAKSVDAALTEANVVLTSEPPGPKDPPADSAHKLIEKLAASGQLKAGFLMRVLSQGQTDLFDLAFARLLDMELPRFRKAFYEGGARPVALSCRAAGIDRSVFNTVFNLSRQARGLSVTLAAPESRDADSIFAAFTRQTAMDELHAALH